jgi:hypothetical protein
MSASKTNGSTTPAWLIAIRPSLSTRTVRGISLKRHGTTRGRDRHDMEATVQASDGSCLFKEAYEPHLRASE